jgi:hypothetical protein
VGQQNIIELNGKRYDAITGAVLGAAQTPVVPAGAAGGHSGLKRTIDGVVRGRSSKVTPHHTVRPAVKPTAAVAAASSTSAAHVPKKMDVSRPVSPAVKHHQPQKGKTLMRRAVHKPNVSIKPKIKATIPSEIAPASVKTIAKPLAKKMSVAHIDPAREIRSLGVQKNQQVRRFQPAPTVRRHHSSAFVPAVASRPAAFAPTRPVAPTDDIRRPVHQAAPQPHHTDIFEAAMASATSHQQPAPVPSRRRTKMVSILAGVAAFLIMGGFLTYLNMPGLQMQFAAMKVGFNADLPTYKPAGYALKGGVKNEDGRVSVSFRSGDSGYTVTQQASDWNSQTLLENFVAVNASSHQTIQSQGRTIYIYNGSNAAWVDGGVRYEVSGNAPLSADDIVKLATSI